MRKIGMNRGKALPRLRNDETSVLLRGSSQSHIRQKCSLEPWTFCGGLSALSSRPCLKSKKCFLFLGSSII